MIYYLHDHIMSSGPAGLRSKKNNTTPDESIISFSIPIETKLTLPSKFPMIQDTITYKSINDISCMHFDNDKSIHLV
jgi:hypothetical protein